MTRMLFALILSLHLLMPMAVWAQDKVKGPLDFSLRYYAIMLGAAMFGGFVAWLNKVRSGQIPLWSISHLIGEVTTAAFAGLMCFWICESAGLPPLLTAPLTGVMGHMGTRGITMLEEWAKRRWPMASDKA